MANSSLNTGAAAAGDSYDGIEGLIGSNFGDSLRDDAGNNYLFGMSGSDSLYGRGGIDTLVGGDADDYLHGGAGGDYLIGGDGFDQVLYSYRRAASPSISSTPPSSIPARRSEIITRASKVSPAPPSTTRLAATRKTINV